MCIRDSWYTLEGRNPKGEVVGGWDLHELRTIQDWTVRYALQSVPGVSEVSSIGGHVQEYQIDIIPDALKAFDLSLQEVAQAVRGSNLDVGARTIEINQAEYVIRSIGAAENIDDLSNTVIAARNQTPVRIRDVAHVKLGPTLRRGALDDGGAESVGGVVVARFGANPMDVTEAIKKKIAELGPSLPTRTLKGGEQSTVSIVPFYDRSELIGETLDTLSSTLMNQLLITLLVVTLMLRTFRSSWLIASMLPLSVLGVFVLMKAFGIDANIMALSGIAIAIGTMVDIGIVFVENITNKLDHSAAGLERGHLVVEASKEVAPAVLTSVLTTIVSFLPVFALTASEGKLFKPLAYTKTFAMGAAFIVALLALPALSTIILRQNPAKKSSRHNGMIAIAMVLLSLWMTRQWMPLGFGSGLTKNLVTVLIVVGLVLTPFFMFSLFYRRLLTWSLKHKRLSLLMPGALIVLGGFSWLGAPRLLGGMPTGVTSSKLFSSLSHTFPGLGREFMPRFDEGDFLFMPTTMSHASFGQSLESLQGMDRFIAAIPEVERVVGKLGRVDSSLDPAPISMFEVLISYKPEYGIAEDGEQIRNWRDHIKSPDDIWTEIQAVAKAPGLTSAPKLMPIETRLVMLQSGMRAPMGIKVKGDSLQTIEAFGKKLEKHLRKVPGIKPESVYAEQIVGKPYLELHIDREAIGRFGLRIADVQKTIQTSVGGMELTEMIAGRERLAVRLRYAREMRNSIDVLKRITVSTKSGQHLPLEQLAGFEYFKGPQVIKSENSFLTSYVLFDKMNGKSEVDVVTAARDYLLTLERQGELQRPAGVTYAFDGAYKHQQRSMKTLTLVVPLVLLVIFLILYLQFRSSAVTLMIFLGVMVCISGGFVLMWLFGRSWFFDVALVGHSIRDLFHIGTVHLSVATWVGIIALVGIATDASVVLMTTLVNRLRASHPQTIDEIRATVIESGCRRIRPCLMTTASTMLALLPVMTSTGRGAELMVPMALPSIGGMGAVLLTLVTVPVLFSWMHESALLVKQKNKFEERKENESEKNDE